MKKRGFTLVELLGAIAILSIILVIAVPKVNDIIFMTREKTFTSNANAIVHQAKNFFMQEHAGALEPITEVYEINDGKLVYEGKQMDLIDGKIEGSGFVQVNDLGEYKLSFENGEFCAHKSFEESEVIISRVEAGVPCGKIYVSLAVELNGGVTNQDFESTYLERTKIVLEEPTRKDYLFSQWKVVKGTSVLKDNVLTIGDEDTIIYAMWDALPKFAVDLNGGTSTQEFDSSYRSGTMFTLANPTKTGYTFSGWEIVEGDSLISGDSITIGSKDTKIKAIWTVNTYTITYNLDGGSSGTNAPTEGEYGSTVEVDNPTRTGYTFAGWTVSGTGASMSGTSLTIGAGNITLTANWTVNTYTISYTLNGGTKGTNAPTSGTYGSTVTIDNPMRTGYTFNGWTVSGTGASMSETSLTIGAGNITLMANWTANTYTISYTLNGGTKGTNSPTSGTYGSTVTVSNPTRTGYTFAGWIVSGTGAIMSGTNLTIGTGNVTLTANWSVITFSLSGSTSTATCKDGNTGGSIAISSGATKTLTTSDLTHTVTCTNSAGQSITASKTYKYNSCISGSTNECYGGYYTCTKYQCKDATKEYQTSTACLKQCSGTCMASTCSYQSCGNVSSTCWDSCLTTKNTCVGGFTQ